MSTQLRRRAMVVVLAVVASLVLASTAGSAATLRGNVSSAKQQVDLSGVTLRAGDQLNSLRTQLHASGEDENVPYEIEWSTFIGGPAVLAAQTGGSVDVGFMAETPLVFAQAAGNPVKVVAVSRAQDPKSSNFALVVKPDSDIKKLSQLKGRKVGYASGTVTQYVLLNALKKAKLAFTDVQAVNIGGLGVLQAFQNGDVDAAVVYDPFLSSYLLAGTARILASGPGLSPGFTYLVAREDALKDKKLDAALSDFVARVTRAQAYWTAHPEVVAATNAANFKVSQEAALAAAKRSRSAYVPIDDSIVKAHQAEADAFLQLGAISTKLDAKKLFDDRYDKVVTAAAAESAADQAQGGG